MTISFRIGARSLRETIREEVERVRRQIQEEARSPDPSPRPRTRSRPQPQPESPLSPPPPPPGPSSPRSNLTRSPPNSPTKTIVEEGGGDEKKSPMTDVVDPRDELALKQQAMDAESFLNAFDSFSCVFCKANSVIVELIFRCLLVAYYCFEV